MSTSPAMASLLASAEEKIRWMEEMTAAARETLSHLTTFEDIERFYKLCMAPAKMAFDYKQRFIEFASSPMSLADDFWQHNVVIDPSAKIECRILYGAYVRYLQLRGYPVMGSKQFGQYVGGKMITSKASGGIRWYSRVRLLAPISDDRLAVVVAGVSTLAGSERESEETSVPSPDHSACLDHSPGDAKIETKALFDATSPALDPRFECAKVDPCMHGTRVERVEPQTGDPRSCDPIPALSERVSSGSPARVTITTDERVVACVERRRHVSVSFDHPDET